MHKESRIRYAPRCNLEHFIQNDQVSYYDSIKRIRSGPFKSHDLLTLVKALREAEEFFFFVQLRLPFCYGYRELTLHPLLLNLCKPPINQSIVRRYWFESPSGSIRKGGNERERGLGQFAASGPSVADFFSQRTGPHLHNLNIK